MKDPQEKPLDYYLEDADEYLEDVEEVLDERQEQRARFYRGLIAKRAVWVLKEKPPSSKYPVNSKPYKPPKPGAPPSNMHWVWEEPKAGESA